MNMDPIPTGSLAPPLFGTALLVGALVGAVEAIALTTVAGTMVALVPIVVGWSAFTGAVGGLFSAAISLRLLKVRGRTEPSFATNFRLALIGTSAGSGLSYLLFFLRQDAQSPAVVVGLPAVSLAIALAVVVSRSASRAEVLNSRGASAPPEIPSGVSSSRPRWPGSISIVVAAILSLLVVAILTAFAVPASISNAPLSETYGLLHQSERLEILFRATVLVALTIGAVIAAVLAAPPRGSQLEMVAAVRARYFAAALAVFGLVTVHASWVSAPISRSLSRLTQVAPPPLVLGYAVTAAGWISLGLAFLLVAIGMRMRSPLAPGLSPSAAAS